MKSETKATKQSHEAQTEEVNNPEVCQHPHTTEIPGHLAAKMHAPYEEKPSVQHVNEHLTDQTTTGYQPHAEETPAKHKK